MIRNIILTILGALVLSATLLAVPLLIWEQKLDAEGTLKFLKIIISWPLAVVIITLVFFGRFRNAIDQFLRGIGIIKIAGTEIQRQQANEPIENPSLPLPEGSQLMSPEQISEIKSLINQLDQEKNTAQLERQKLEALYRETWASSFYWKFEFLNRFFVYYTKQVLHWICISGVVPLLEFNSIWQQTIPNPIERDAIKDALINYGMIQAEAFNLKITPEGISFLQHIGMIPRQQAQMNTGG